MNNVVMKKLPKFCYSKLLESDQLILIKRGESGYYPVLHAGGDAADDLNEAIGVTKAQREAMEIGSMFGWDVPGADPDFYSNMEL